MIGVIKQLSNCFMLRAFACQNVVCYTLNKFIGKAERFECSGKAGVSAMFLLEKKAEAALHDYLQEARPKLLKEGVQSTALFLNNRGNQLSDRSIRKIVEKKDSTNSCTKKNKSPCDSAFLCYTLVKWRGGLTNRTRVVGSSVVKNHTNIHACK